jgi:hypothetical protein
MKREDLVGDDPLKDDHEQDKEGVASLDLQLELSRLVSKRCTELCQLTTKRFRHCHCAGHQFAEDEERLLSPPLPNIGTPRR